MNEPEGAASNSVLNRFGSWLRWFFPRLWWRLFRDPIALLTAALVIVTAWSAISASHDATQALIAANRPWLRVWVRANGPVRLDARNFSVSVTFAVTNTGHSPAMNVGIYPKLFFAASRSIQQAELKKIISDNGRGPVSPSPVALFPGETATFPWVINTPAADAIKVQGTYYPVLMGTVVYETALDSNLHQTTFAVNLLSDLIPKEVAKRRSPQASNPGEEVIPARDVLIVADPAAGSYVD